MNIDKLKFPIIRKVFPELMAAELSGIQPMTKIPERKRHWKIVSYNGKWVLSRWWSGFFVGEAENDVTEFESEEAAISQMVLEQMEQ